MKHCIKKILKPSLAATFTIIYLLLSTPVNALNMYDDNYILRMGNLDMVAGKSSGSGKKLGITMGELGSGLYSKEGSNYKVRAGFQYVLSGIPFSFKIINTSIDFGTITAGTPISRTSNLQVSNGSAYGYTVTVNEDHSLLSFPYGITIPDTTCDTGACDPTTSALWQSDLTYGFGYRCDNVSGTDCAISTTAGFYRPFAASPSATTVMSSSQAGRNKEVQVTYKLNVSGTQPAGLYQNILTYVATPTF